MSSLSNFAVNIYIARNLGAAPYGAFSLAYVTYSFALNASRGLATDPLMVRFSYTDRRTWRRAVKACTGTALVVGLVAGVCVLAAAVVLGGTVGRAFLALGLALPGLMVQDSWRFAFFADGRGRQAFVNDMIWLVALVPALAAVQATHRADVFSSVLVWGAAATVAAAAGPLQARVLPRPLRAREWLSRQRDLGFRYMVEGTANSASNQMRNYAIGLVLGLAAVGYVQAANTLMGPFVVLVLGTGLIILPEATRIWRDAPERMIKFCAVISFGYTLLAVAWTSFLMVTLPLGLGEWLLGDIWRPSYPLVLPTALSVMGYCVTAGAGTGLHGTGSGRRSLRAAVVTAIVYVVCSLAGALAGGAVGAVVGTAVATWSGALVYWWQLGAALRESGKPVGRLTDGSRSRPPIRRRA